MQQAWIRRGVAVAILALTFGLAAVNMSLADEGDGDRGNLPPAEFLVK